MLTRKFVKFFKSLATKTFVYILLLSTTVFLIIVQNMLISENSLHTSDQLFYYVKSESIVVHEGGQSVAKNVEKFNVLSHGPVLIDKTTIKSNRLKTGHVIKPKKSHTLENFCKYPVWNPRDDSLIPWLGRHKIPENCGNVLPRIVNWKNGRLYIDQKVALVELRSKVVCRYRPIGGTLKPARTSVRLEGQFVNFTNATSKISEDQIYIECFRINETVFNDTKAVYKLAFAQASKRENKTFADNNENRLSLNLIVLDSTSRNAFRRHMPSSWRYLKADLGAMDLEGFVKVADNTAVNMMPLLTGLRYGNMSADMITDFPLKANETMDLEKVPFLWRHFQDNGCVTMLNDDPVYANMGMFHYPAPECKGFGKKPTEYWYRPWHIIQRILKGKNLTQNKLCFGNSFNFDLQLQLTEQLSKLYKNKCYFSLTLLTEIGHDNSEFLELLDIKFKKFLQRLKMENAMNHSIFVVMGDHGQRINLIRNAYLGRAEERMPLFAIVFPEWFRKKHPDLMKTFRLNKYRLTSHYDIHQTLKDIAEGYFSTESAKYANIKYPRSQKGLSLLRNVIPANRTCVDANVPENHCVCLIPYEKQAVKKRFRKRIKRLITQYIDKSLTNYPKCVKVRNIKILNVTWLTMNDLVLNGIRLIGDNVTYKNAEIFGKNRVDFLEIFFSISPINMVAIIRLQYYKAMDLLTINVTPLVLEAGDSRDENYNCPFPWNFPTLN